MKISSAWITIALLAGGIAWAQPPDFAVFPGDEGRQQHRWQEDRLTRLADYLELSEAQATEWQAIADQHNEAGQARWEQITGLREEFRQLADQDSPNLEQLGQVALEIHREMESTRSTREQLIGDLEGILTPEQMEKFEALKTAREFAGPRGRRGHRSGRTAGDND